MNRNELPVTADLFYALRHGERFSEEALAAWGTPGAYIHSASIKLPKLEEFGSLDDQALALAEELFNYCNSPQWYDGTHVLLRSPDADPYTTKRSMCVGDVVQFIFPHADACITVGCRSMGFTIIGRT